MSGWFEFLDDCEGAKSENDKKACLKKYIHRKFFGYSFVVRCCIFDIFKNCYGGVQMSQREILEYLIAEGGDIEEEMSDERDVFGGWRCLHWMAFYGKAELMKVLIANNCCIDCVTDEGLSPLDIATKYKYSDCVQLLQTAMANRPRDGLSNDLELLRKTSLLVVLDREKRSTFLDRLLINPDPRIKVAIKSRTVTVQEMNDWRHLDVAKVHPVSYRLLQECLLYRCIRQKYIDGFLILCTPDIVNRERLFMGPTALECAVDSGLLFFVQFIVEKLVHVDDSWTISETLAKNKGRTDMATVISDRRTYLSNREKNGYSRLHIAVYDNDPSLIDYLLKNRGVDPGYGDKTVGTALSLAYDHDYFRCVQNLQDNKLNVNTSDRLRRSALHIAISNRNESQSEYIIEHSSCLETKDFMGLTALQMSVIANCRVICEGLLKKGSVYDRHINFPSALLDTDCDLNMVLFKRPYMTLTNQETIYSLCYKVNRTIYPSLLDTIDQRTVDLADASGNTLLHLCARDLLADICSHLISRKANVDYINASNNTPLLELLKHNYKENVKVSDQSVIDTVNVLVAGGASLDVMDSGGRTLLEIATLYNDEKLLLALIHKEESFGYTKAQHWTTWLDKEFFTVIRKLISLADKSLIKQWITVDIIKQNIKCNDITLLKSLYDLADVEVQREVVESILHKAAMVDDRKLFTELIMDDVSDCSYIEGGESLLNVLIRHGKEDYCRIVIRSRNGLLWMDKANFEDKGPLHIAIERGNWNIVEQIIAATTIVDGEDIYGDTPMSLIFDKISESTEDHIIDGLMAKVRMLITKGADINKVNKLNRTIISYCTRDDLKSDIQYFFLQQHCQLLPTPAPRLKTPSRSSTPTTPNSNFGRQSSDTSVPKCVICDKEPMNTVLNCGHELCMTCAEVLEKCPICLQPVTIRIKRFL